MKPAPPKKPPHLSGAKITRSPPSGEEAKAIREEMTTLPDRAAGVVAAAYLENSLERFLAHQFVVLKEQEAENIFGPNGGFLSAAVAKARLAHALGLFGPLARDACLTIFDVRNKFAHAPRSVSFATNAIKNTCDALDLHNKYVGLGMVEKMWEGPEDARDKYILTVYVLTLCMDRLKLEEFKNRRRKAADKLKHLRSTIKVGDKADYMRDVLDDVERTLLRNPKPMLP